MKLTKKHIGKLFDVHGADGSWVYLLVDVKKGKLLFYTFHGNYEIDSAKSKDWRRFVPLKRWPSDWKQIGWNTGREYFE